MRERAPLSVAMIRMRLRLGLTQAELAKALNVALPTVGRWESWDPPRGISLERIARFAESHGLEEAADFKYVIAREHAGVLPVWIQTDQETEYVKALLMVLREQKFTELRLELKKFLEGIMAKNGNGGKASDASLMRGVKQMHGTAAPEPGQGKRTPDSGSGGTNVLSGRGTMEKK